MENLRQKVSIELDASVAFSSFIALDSVTHRIEKLAEKGVQSDQRVYDLVSNLSDELKVALSKILTIDEVEFLMKINA